MVGTDLRHIPVENQSLSIEEEEIYPSNLEAKKVRFEADMQDLVTDDGLYSISHRTTRYGGCTRASRHHLHWKSGSLQKTEARLIEIKQQDQMKAEVVTCPNDDAGVQQWTCLREADCCFLHASRRTSA